MAGTSGNGIDLGGIDHVEFWVGNARQAAQFWASAFGFDVIAHAGPETGVRDRVSYVLAQGDIRFVLTGAVDPASAVATHHANHGDGVRDIAFLVSDVRRAYDAAVERGAPSVREPWVTEDDTGKLTRATVATYGDTVHTFVDRAAYSGAFAPGFETVAFPRTAGLAVGLRAFDHVVANVPLGHLEEWVGYYRDVFGFDQLVHFDDEQIHTEYSALMSTVVWDGSKVVLPINEPAAGKRKSQIEEYLDYYGTPGVQHIALRTDDIVSAVRAMRARGLRFLEVPDAYYDDAHERLEGVELPWESIATLGILVDRDPDGHLLQIFTEMIGDRPTVFVEVIQREGSRGFGLGNFKALFEAIEREQARRGNL